MDKIFNFFWAVICAWLIMWLLGLLGVWEWASSSSIANFVSGWGWPAKKVLFIILILILWITGLHKYIGRLVGSLIGIAGVLLVAGLVILLAYWFITWLAGCL